MKFEKYPFEKLNELLKDITPNDNYELSALTIGEPKFETPKFIQDELKNTTSFLQKYPASAGLPELKEAMLTFVKNRFNVELQMSEIIPTFGTREVLFNFPQFALFDKKDPVIAFTNPFYQIYEGAAIASRAEIIHIDLTKENNFKATLSDEELKRCDLVILNYPNNPTSAEMTKEELGEWVKKALEFDFILVNDECYSEIYFDENDKPVSLLEASVEVGNSSFKNVLVMNSISKRSSAPGLRSGFIAGDKEILEEYMKYRTYVGCASPVPLQKTAALAWSETSHVDGFRKIYKRNFELAQEILGIKPPQATFYIWLEVEDELEFTKNLFKEKHIKVLPGSFLGRNGIGKGYVRIALVENEEKTKEVLKRLKDFIDG
ncbi:succinyldiaminopimelate transaminase [Halarcobacter sp.]|uniref:succinyldiaminopimelate transaminase n=1 Tax=Halarcobacter sp. TaxID=2321133 RepID=UPI003A905E8B